MKDYVLNDIDGVRDAVMMLVASEPVKANRPASCRQLTRGDEETVGEVLAIVHTTESPLKAYNDEAELSGSVKLAYIAARDKYDI